VRRSRRRR
jgi:putative tryptophan/tyrosine transport system substrate-binding protein